MRPGRPSPAAALLAIATLLVSLALPATALAVLPAGLGGTGAASDAPTTTPVHTYDSSGNLVSAAVVDASRTSLVVSPAGTAQSPSLVSSADRLAPSGAIGFTEDAVGSAFHGMRGGGGHASRHVVDEGLIPNSGSLASRVELFEDLTTPVLTNPARTFDWRLGNTATRAFVGGTPVVVFVAKDGPYQAVVVSAIVPDANQIAQWGL